MQERPAILQSGRDCVLQPRAARNELPWVSGPQDFSTPTGLCHVLTVVPQSRWGCFPLLRSPRAARSSQPWAWCRNPFGVHLWNFRKVLGLGGLLFSDVSSLG